MSDDSTILRKGYQSAFLVDKPKLSRMLGIIEQRFSEQELTFKPSIKVTMKNGKMAELRSLDQLFSLDNTVRNPIESLEVTAATAISDANPSPVAEAYLNYGGDESESVEFSVTGVNAKWVNELFAELEEQVERTLLRTWVYRFVKTGDILLLGLFLMMMLAGGFVILFDSNPGKLNLSEQAVHHLSRQADAANTSEEKLSFLFEMHRQQLKQLPTRSFKLQALFTVRAASLALPLLIIIGISAYVFIVCYPSSVFAWGDYGEHFAGLVAKRRTLWTVIVAAFFVGVIANLFVASLAIGKG